MTDNPAAFKHNLNHEVVEVIAAALAATHDSFAQPAFEATAKDGLLDLELKDRVRHVVAAMRPFLPSDGGAAVDVVRRAALGLYPGGEKVSGWANWPLIDFVGDHGLDSFDASLEALRQMTHLWSAEFAIRPYFRADVERTLHTVQCWLTDPDEHVRRLVSEGSRPRLPWGGHLSVFRDDPAPLYPLLRALRDDTSEYVRRSVANNLNDIAKDHPDALVEEVRAWLPGASPARRKLVKHAFRSLVKAGHSGALDALGFRPDAPVRVDGLTVTPNQASVGGAVEIRFELVSESVQSEALVVDYAVHHVKAAGHRTPMVFKLKTLELAAGATVKVRKKHSLKKVTTRVYYPGAHAVEILVNGSARGIVEFDLRV